MTKRDEMLAVISERDNEAIRHAVLSWHWWNVLAWYHLREARRLLALNERDLAALPPARYHKPRPSAVNVRRTG